MKIAIPIIWIMGISVSSVVQYPDDGIVSHKLTDSGMVVHFLAYFVASALLYWAYKRDGFFFIVFSGFTIFIFSVLLEVIQFYLPYRSFNPTDIAANGAGICLFIFIWMINYSSLKKKEIQYSRKIVNSQNA